MRDRLIELLKIKYDHFCDQCGVNKDSKYIENLADYLLENGVILPPVKAGGYSEIIKALECCCVAEQQICRESKCPLFGNGNCFTELAINALDLINRQKAEIEQLTQNLKFVRGTVERQKRENEILCQNADTAFQDGLNEAQDLYREQIKSEVKAEAIKEFAERLKGEMTKSKYTLTVSPYSRACNAVISFWTDEIDNLVKEMVGTDNA